MALVNKPTAALKYTWRDASGSIGHTLIHVPFATSTTLALAAGNAIAATLPAISGCVVLSFDLTYAYVQDAPGDPASGSRVEDKGVFNWLCANGLQSGFSIPGIIDAVLLPDGRIDQANTDIVALVTVVEDVGALFCSISGSDIVSLASAYQRFSRTSKRQAAPR